MFHTITCRTTCDTILFCVSFIIIYTVNTVHFFWIYIVTVITGTSYHSSKCFKVYTKNTFIADRRFFNIDFIELFDILHVLLFIIPLTVNPFCVLVLLSLYARFTVFRGFVVARLK